MVVAVKGSVDAVDQLIGGEQAGGLDDAALAVSPLGLDGVQPGALDRQVAIDDADATPAPFDAAIVGADPGADRPADVPGGIVPDQQQRLLARRLQSGAAPSQVLGRRGADRAAVDEAQPGLLVPTTVLARGTEQQAIAGQRLGVRVVRRDRLFDQPERLVRLGPTVQGRLRQAAPPDLVLEAQDPGRMARRQADQAVAAAFFRAYSGSGLVIQRLARFQPIPNRLSVSRIVSSLTRSAVKPCSKLTSAARSSVHRLVGLPNVRGLWCSTPRSRSALAGSKAARLVFDRCEPRCRAAVPRALNAWIASRTVWSSQPRWRAIDGARSCRALASTIWHRRRTKASEERRPASTCARSASVISRTKMGGRILTSMHRSRLTTLESH